MRFAALASASIVLVVTLLAACGSSAPTLTGRTWVLTAFTSKSPAFQGDVPDYQQSDHSITFNMDGTFAGTAACNHIAGTYTTSGTTLTITAGPSTPMFCPDGSDDLGSIFIHSLVNASTDTLTSSSLKIALSDGGSMTFGPPPVVVTAQPAVVRSPIPGADPPDVLVGKVWKLNAITAVMPAFRGVLPVAEQASYTIEFGADGTFTAKADCNQLAGTYTLERGDSGPGPLEPGGGGITMLPAPATIGACSPGSLGDLYVVGLVKAKGVEFGRDQLTLTSRDGGAFVFGF